MTAAMILTETTEIAETTPPAQTLPEMTRERASERYALVTAVVTRDDGCDLLPAPAHPLQWRESTQYLAGTTRAEFNSETGNYEVSDPATSYIYICSTYGRSIETARWLAYRVASAEVRATIAPPLHIAKHQTNAAADAAEEEAANKPAARAPRAPRAASEKSATRTPRSSDPDRLRYAIYWLAETKDEHGNKTYAFQGKRPTKLFYSANGTSADATQEAAARAEATRLSDGGKWNYEVREEIVRGSEIIQTASLFQTIVQ